MSEATAPQPDTMVREAIVASHLVKRYPRFRFRRDRLLALIGFEHRLDATVALDDVSFTVSPGEAFGVIGENGSGKSTLLKIVAGISDPDAGELAVRAPSSAILELGLGFHPEFTGRQNAVMYGSLVGLPQEAMARRLDEILAFAELGEFIDQPLRTYSTGMTARLAFSVATSVDPAVLVVDEALAVGDSAFQKKCVDRMIRLKQDGCTILFCSHAMYLVTRFCERALWLHNGHVERIGRVDEVVEAYESYQMHRSKRTMPAAGSEWPASKAGKLPARLRRMRVEGPNGRSSVELAPGDGVTITLEIEMPDPAVPCHVGVAIDAADGRCVFAAGTHFDGRPPLVGRGEHTAQLRIPSLPLTSGAFIVSGFLLDDSGVAAYDQVAVQGALQILGPSWTPSMLRLDHEWESPSWP